MKMYQYWVNSSSGRRESHPDSNRYIFVIGQGFPVYPLDVIIGEF